jgi:wobble nucleotide-excising tRNase
MSKTPICDRWEYDSYSGGLVVPLNVAKDLETELAEARAEIDKLNAEVERLKGVVISQITPEPLCFQAIPRLPNP